MQVPVRIYIRVAMGYIQPSEGMQLPTTGIKKKRVRILSYPQTRVSLKFPFCRHLLQFYKDVLTYPVVTLRRELVDECVCVSHIQCEFKVLILILQV